MTIQDMMHQRGPDIVTVFPGSKQIAARQQHRHHREKQQPRNGQSAVFFLFFTARRIHRFDSV